MKKICPICNINFNAKRRITKYCSRKCYWKSLEGKPAWNKGIKTGPNDKISKAKKGKPAWNKGKKFPEISGEKNGRWIKDRTKLVKRQERNDSAYKEWRNLVLKRDNYQCKICGEKYTKEHKLVVHHILPWKDYPELRYNINNGITLCQFHHPRKRVDERRRIPEFKKLVVSYEQ